MNKIVYVVEHSMLLVLDLGRHFKLDLLETWTKRSLNFDETLRAGKARLAHGENSLIPKDSLLFVLLEGGCQDTLMSCSKF